MDFKKIIALTLLCTACQQNFEVHKGALESTESLKASGIDISPETLSALAAKAAMVPPVVISPDDIDPRAAVQIEDGETISEVLYTVIPSGFQVHRSGSLSLVSQAKAQAIWFEDNAKDYKVSVKSTQPEITVFQKSTRVESKIRINLVGGYVLLAFKDFSIELRFTGSQFQGDQYGALVISDNGQSKGLMQLSNTLEKSLDRMILGGQKYATFGVAFNRTNELNSVYDGQAKFLTRTALKKGEVDTHPGFQVYRNAALTVRTTTLQNKVYFEEELSAYRVTSLAPSYGFQVLHLATGKVSKIYLDTAKSGLILGFKDASIQLLPGKVTKKSIKYSVIENGSSVRTIDLLISKNGPAELNPEITNRWGYSEQEIYFYR